MQDIILIGFGGHGKSVADCIERAKEYTIIGYVDNHKCLTNYSYLGTDEVLETQYLCGVRNVVICIGYLGKGNLREKLYYKLKTIGFRFPIIIDPSAIISETALIGEGSFISKGAIINSNVVIGKISIVNTMAIVEHECKIGDFAHISVSAVLCGQVIVGVAAFIGANATVIECRQIKDRQIIPAGIVVR